MPALPGLCETRGVSPAKLSAPATRRPVRHRGTWLLIGVLLLLAACGGGGGGGPAPAPSGQNPDGSYVDGAAYSTLATASLANAVDGAAVTKKQTVLNGNTIAYTATAGHLIARDPANGRD